MKCDSSFLINILFVNRGFVRSLSLIHNRLGCWLAYLIRFLLREDLCCENRWAVCCFVRAFMVVSCITDILNVQIFASLFSACSKTFYSGSFSKTCSQAFQELSLFWKFCHENLLLKIRYCKMRLSKEIFRNNSPWTSPFRKILQGLILVMGFSRITRL